MRKKIFPLFLALFCLIIINCQQKESPKSGDSENSISTKPNGKVVYDTYCVICHGATGKMGNNGAHDLSISELTIKEKIAVISEGRKLMTPFKGILSREEIKAVAQYTEKLKNN